MAHNVSKSCGERLSIKDITDEALKAKLMQELEHDDLCGGRAPGFSTTIGSSTGGAAYVGNPTRQLLVSHRDVDDLETVDDLWEWESVVTGGLIAEVGKLLVQGANATEPVVVSDAEGLRLALARSAGLLLPWAAKESESLPKATGKLVLASRAVEAGEAYVLRGGEQAQFVLDPTAGLRNEGMRHRAVLSVHVARLGGQAEVTRLVVPFGVVIDLWAEGEMRDS